MTRQLGTGRCRNSAGRSYSRRRQAERKVHVQNLLMSVRSKVLEGHSLAQALQQSGRFPELYIATIAAGERSGHLDLILDQLADYTENRFAMQKRFKGR